VKNPASVEEAARLKAQAKEAKWDNIFMVLAVVMTIVVISALMVSVLKTMYAVPY